MFRRSLVFVGTGQSLRIVSFSRRRLPGFLSDYTSEAKGASMPAHLTVWYNTRCPVCDAGIDWQRNKLLALVRAGTVEFRDINEQPDALAQFGASLDDIRRRLHATDEAGRLIVGADVAIALWLLTPRERWLAALSGNRVALPFTRFFYDRFADLLFAWNRWCGRW
jgi:predicted DCC family thiol-disulfide oxidoreductase YuxK